MVKPKATSSKSSKINVKKASTKNANALSSAGTRQSNAKKQISGSDSDGKRYKDISVFWKAVQRTWYPKIKRHWDAEEASFTGVLGGLPHTHSPDIEASKQFLQEVKPHFGSVLDCGAGVGRVTQALLLDFFQQVDLVEASRKLLDTAKKNIQDSKARRFVCSSLQNFKPGWFKYNVIWVQWVLLHLTDRDVVAFLRKCKQFLKPGGMIFIKDNTILRGGWLVNVDDYSIARTNAQYKVLFQKAGLKLISDKLQTKWPKDLVPVKMYACVA